MSLPLQSCFMSSIDVTIIASSGRAQFAIATARSDRTVIAAYGAGVFRDLAHFWGAAASLCEVTNVFLTVEECVLCAPNVYAPGLRRFLDLGFKAAYVVFRLALFPALLWRQRVDLAAMPPTDRARLGFFELYFFPGAVLFVLALSCKWALDAAAPTKARRDSC